MFYDNSFFVYKYVEYMCKDFSKPINLLENFDFQGKNIKFQKLLIFDIFTKKS